MRERITLPFLPLRGFVVFPRQIVNFDVGRVKARKALEKAMGDGSEILLGVQKEPMMENPGPEDVWDTVMSMKINKVFKDQKILRVLGEVTRRTRLVQFHAEGEWYEATVESEETMPMDPEYELALCRVMKESFEEYSQLADIVPHAVFMVMGLKHAGDVADLIAANLPGDREDQLDLFLERDPAERARRIIANLEREKQVAQIRSSLNTEVGKELRDMQRESFLREEMAVIRRQLGEDDSEDDPVLADMVQNERIPQVVRDKIRLELKRLSKMAPSSPEYGVIQDYLDRVKEVPWIKTPLVQPPLAGVRAILDDDHYGMKRVKDRIVELAASKELKPDVKSPVICLVGPPGIGKTSVASSIASALGREFVRVSLGGIRDEAEIRGHRRTYIGSMPGRIIHAMIQAGTSNPVMLLDEVDKMASDLRGDPTAALLEVLDTALNSEFRDAYLELPVDLSDVLFITTANTLEGIPLPLIDRMEIIELESYSRSEKLEIGMRYLLPRQRREYGLKASQIKISRQIMSRIIAEYTHEAGVRELERLIGSLCRKAVTLIVEQQKSGLNVTDRNLPVLMEEPPILEDERRLQPEIGVVNGLAWTALGGEVLTVEATVFDGSGKLELTGQMGDVMKESAQIALSVVRGYDLPDRDAKYYREHDMHIHIPAGAVPKDGPSAGITLATAIYSILSGRYVRNDVAMTGELSLRGRVLPIGGLKEKLLAAGQRGIREVLVPEMNRLDVQKLPSHVTDGMQIHYVKSFGEVLELALVPESLAAEGK